MQERGDELNLLLHALGKLFGLFRQGVGDLHAFSPLSGALARFLRRDPVQLAKEDQLVDDLHLLVEAALLGQVADALQALAVKGLLEEADASRVGNGDAHHHANGAGFARSVGAEQAEDLARLDGQAQVADGDLALVGLGHSREFDYWHGFSRCSICILDSNKPGERYESSVAKPAPTAS